MIARHSFSRFARFTAVGDVHAHEVRIGRIGAGRPTDAFEGRRRRIALDLRVDTGGEIGQRPDAVLRAFGGVAVAPLGEQDIARDRGREISAALGDRRPRCCLMQINREPVGVRTQWMMQRVDWLMMAWGAWMAVLVCGLIYAVFILE